MSEALKKIEERHQGAGCDACIYVGAECRSPCELVRLARALVAATSALRSYQYGNSAAELAKEVADTSERVLAEVAGMEEER